MILLCNVLTQFIQVTIFAMKGDASFFCMLVMANSNFSNRTTCKQCQTNPIEIYVIETKAQSHCDIRHRKGHELIDQRNNILFLAKLLPIN